MFGKVYQVENPLKIKKHIGDRKPYWLFLTLEQILLVLAPYVLGHCISALENDSDTAKLLLVIYIVLMISIIVEKSYRRICRSQLLIHYKDYKRKRLFTSIQGKEISGLFIREKGSWIYLFYHELNEYCEDSWKFWELIMEIGMVLFTVTISLAVLNLSFLPVFWLLFPICVYYSLKKADICLTTHSQRHASGNNYQKTLKEDLENFYEITCLNAKNFFRGRFEKASESVEQAEVAHAGSVRTYQLYEKGFEFICYAAVFLMAITLILHNQLGIGYLITVLSYAAVFYRELSQINYAKDLYLDIAAIKNDLQSIEAIKEMRYGTCSEASEQTETANTLRNVRYCYQDGEVLSYNLEFRKGEIAALLGNSGKGKTTFFRMLTGIAEPVSGELLIYGKPIKDYSEEFLRNKIVYMTQMPYLWEGTVADNLLMIKDDKQAEQDLQRLLLDCKLSDKVMPDASNFSGGERQRIALLRTLYENGDIYLLDEPTSNLDNAASEAVYSMIRERLRGKTVIIISHDNNVGNYVDRVIDFDEQK